MFHLIKYNRKRTGFFKNPFSSWILVKKQLKNLFNQSKKSNFAD